MIKGLIAAGVCLLASGLGCAQDASPTQALWSQLRIAVDTNAQFSPAQAWQHTQAAEALRLQQANQVLSKANGPPHWAGFVVPKADFGHNALWLSLKSPTQDHSEVWVRLDDIEAGSKILVLEQNLGLGLSHDGDDRIAPPPP